MGKCMHCDSFSSMENFEDLESIFCCMLRKNVAEWFSLGWHQKMRNQKIWKWLFAAGASYNKGSFKDVLYIFINYRQKQHWLPERWMWESECIVIALVLWKTLKTLGLFSVFCWRQNSCWMIQFRMTSKDEKPKKLEMVICSTMGAGGSGW